MTAPNTYFVDIIGFDEEIDIMPMVHEVIAKCPYQHDFSPLEVAELTERAARGEYIPVDTLDWIEDRMLGDMTGKILGWVRSEYRIAQLRDPDLHRWRPFLYLDCFDDVPSCGAVRQLLGRSLEPEELVRLPLDDCDSDVCSCTYHTCSWRDAAKRHPEWIPSKLAERNQRRA